MRYEKEGYLAHYGVKGQQWGVRRYQNEDGTLTEEGKRHYYDAYDELENKADEDIERAKSQIADIKQNGWNAESAFEKGFIKQLKSEGMLNDENLKFFADIFKTDLKEAMANKKAAKLGKEFLDSMNEVTYNDIVSSAKTIDQQTVEKGEHNSIVDKVQKIGDNLGLERKESDRKAVYYIPDYDDDVKKQINKSFTPKEVKQDRDVFYDYFKSMDMGPMIDKYIKGKPVEEQYWIMLNVYNQLVDQFS